MMSSDFIHNLTEPIKWLLVFILFLLTLFLGYYLELDDQIVALDQARAQMGTVQLQLIRKQKAVATFAAATLQMAALKKLFVQRSNLLGKEQLRVSDLLANIARLGAMNDVTFKTIKPLAKQQHDFLMVLPIQIVVLGSYEQLAHFMHDVSKGRNFFMVPQNFTLSPMVGGVDPKAELELSMTLLSYHLVTLPAVQRFASNNITVKTRHSPFFPHEKNSMLTNATSLSQFSLVALHMVGRVQQDHKIWALITVPDGQVYWVTVSSAMGVNGGRVKYITPDKVVVLEQGCLVSLPLVISHKR